MFKIILVLIALILAVLAIEPFPRVLQNRLLEENHIGRELKYQRKTPLKGKIASKEA